MYLLILWEHSLIHIQYNLYILSPRYKQDVSSEQKEALLELLRIHSHSQITPEIRRELVNSKCRDEETAQPADMNL